MTYKAVIFDLDGTLLNTLGDLTEGVNRALSRFSFPPRSKEEVRRFIGDGVKLLIKRCLPEGAGDEATVEKVLKCFDGYYSREGLTKYTEPYEGIYELLSFLESENIKLCVASNKSDAAVKTIIPFFFGDRFLCFEGTQSFDERKPKPTLVKRVLKKSEVSEGDALFVGDSEIDFKTAKNCGMDFLAVSWGFRDYEKLAALPCPFIAKTPYEAIQIIKKMGEIKI